MPALHIQILLNHCRRKYDPSISRILFLAGFCTLVQLCVGKLFTGDEDESRGELFEDNDTLALVSTSKKNADFAGSQSRPQ